MCLFRRFVPILLALGAATCAGSSSPTAPDAANLSGAWTGVGNDSQGAMTMTWSLTQSGNAVQGSVNTRGLNDGTCASCHKTKSGTVSGTISDNTLTLAMFFASGGDVPSPMCVVTFSATAVGITSGTVNAAYTGTESCEGPITNGTFLMTR